MTVQNKFFASKHIAVVAGDYPTSGHMKMVFVQQLVHAMIEQGTKITVLAPQSIMHAIVHKKKLLARKEIQKTESGNEYVVYRPYIITAGNLHLFTTFFNRLNNKILSIVLRKIDPQVLYAHFWSSAKLVDSYANKKAVPVFVACGEGDNALEDLVSLTPQKDLHVLFSVVKGVISVSSENKRKCIDYKLADADCIDVFPNCVNTELFQLKDKHEARVRIGASDEDFIIAFVGGFIPRKGPDKLAKAISIINDPSIKVMFIGKEFPGYPFRFDCPGILFKGPLEHNRLPDYLSAADVFILPTQNEGCSNAIVEALALGLPVISSNRPFNDDILDEFNSIRINPDNVQDIIDAILKLKNNPYLRAQMSIISLSRHNQYSIKERAKRILSFIESKLM